jgi:hypothetical protein
MNGAARDHEMQWLFLDSDDGDVRVVTELDEVGPRSTSHAGLGADLT